MGLKGRTGQSCLYGKDGYELGFADGHDVPVVLICGKEKREKLPFDVNQRDTYFYGTDSQGDWEKLGEEIEKRLRKAIDTEVSEKKEKVPVAKEVGNDKDKLGEAERVMLRIFYYDSEKDKSLREKSKLKGEMENLGFASSDITDAFNKLELGGMIDLSGGNYREKIYNYSLTDKGRRWCFANREILNLTSQGKNALFPS